MNETTFCDEHGHQWEDRWYPYSATTLKKEKWRRCVIPGCDAKQVKEVKF